jgi:hypothetical protein
MKGAVLIFLAILISMVIISDFGPGNDVISQEERRGGPMSFPGHPDDQFPGMVFGQDTQLTTDDRAMLEDIITKSELMSRRLEDSIARLKQEGEDVGNMEVLLAEYTRLVGDARMYLEMSNTSSGTVPLNDSGDSSPVCTSEEECLVSSRESLIQANTRLKNIFDELRPYLAPHAMLPENARLIAQGSGTVVLLGDLDIHMSLSGGKISYLDFENDVSVRLENDVNPEISTTDAKQKVISYNNVTGNITLSGSGFMVEIRGTDISLIARGAGKAELFGDGIYYIEDGNIPANIPVKRQLWKPPLFENN